jgi:hypothetical protein
LLYVVASYLLFYGVREILLQMEFVMCREFFKFDSRFHTPAFRPHDINGLPSACYRLWGNGNGDLKPLTPYQTITI